MKQDMQPITLAGRFTDLQAALTKGKVPEDTLYGDIYGAGFGDDHPFFAQRRLREQTEETEQYRITELTKENGARFRSVITEEYLSRLSEQGQFGYGALYQENGAYTPVGALLFTLEEKDAPGDELSRSSIRIDWLYVAEGFRRTGAASRLVLELLSRISGQEGISVFFDLVPGAEGETELGLFLESAGFLFTPEYAPYLRESLSAWNAALKEAVGKKAGDPEEDRILPLSDEMAVMAARRAFSCGAEELEQYDAEASVILLPPAEEAVTSGTTSALFFRERGGNLLRLERIAGSENLEIREFEELLGAALAAVRDKYGARVEITFVPASEEEADLVNALFPDRGLALFERAFLLPKSAPVSALRMAIREHTELPENDPEERVASYDGVAEQLIRLYTIHARISLLGYSAAVLAPVNENPFLSVATDRPGTEVKVYMSPDEPGSESGTLRILGTIPYLPEEADGHVSEDSRALQDAVRERIAVWDAEYDFLNIDYDVVREQLVCLSMIPVANGVPEEDTLQGIFGTFFAEFYGFCDMEKGGAA